MLPKMLEKIIRHLKIKFFLFLSPFLRVLELPFISIYGRRPLKFEPVFIIGAPRTGSTILYQAITNHFDVLYIDNLASIFYRNLFFGLGLSNLLFGRKAHGNFKADHGDTSSYGLHAPSECGEFWYRFIPKNQHYLAPEEVSERAVQAIRQELTALINFHGRPLVINNNNIGLRLALIKQAFPMARFIVTDREPLYVAQSLLKARLRFYGDVHSWWSMKPENYLQLLKLEPAKQVVHQHHSIRITMIEDLKGAQGRVLWVDYARLKDFIEPGMSSVHCFLPYLVSLGGAVPVVHVSDKIDFSPDMVEEIQNAIKELSWDDYPR